VLVFLINFEPYVELGLTGDLVLGFVLNERENRRDRKEAKKVDFRIRALENEAKAGIELQIIAMSVSTKLRSEQSQLYPEYLVWSLDLHANVCDRGEPFRIITGLPHHDTIDQTANTGDDGTNQRKRWTWHALYAYKTPVMKTASTATFLCIGSCRFRTTCTGSSRIKRSRATFRVPWITPKTAAGLHFSPTAIDHG